MNLTCPHCRSSVDPVGLETCASCDGSLVVADRYRLESIRGWGTSGPVYSALTEDGYRVAVKVIPLDRADWHSGEEFERAVHLLRGLRHDGLPEVYECERDDVGKLYVVREYFDDDTLQERVDNGRRVDPASLETLLAGLLEVAQYLHNLVPPLLHRDIRPANVMFRHFDGWNPVLLDFESVAIPERADLTLSAAGTSPYAPPEQAHGEATPLSDLYSIGLTIVFVATHLSPDELDRDPETGRFLLHDRLDAVDERVRALLERLIASDPERRPASAREALAELQPERALEQRAAPAYVPPDEMAPHEIEARIEGWLSLGDHADDNPRLLVPYLARLDAIGYDRFRLAVASRGGIQVEVLDHSVEQERKQFERPPARRSRFVDRSDAPPARRRQLHSRRSKARQPGRSSRSGVFFVLIFVCVAGVVIAHQTFDAVERVEVLQGSEGGAVAANDDESPQADTGSAASAEAGATCDGADWLDVVEDDGADGLHCLYWGARDPKPRLGCAESTDTLSEVCTTIRDHSETSPDRLTEEGVWHIVDATRTAGLQPLLTGGTLLEHVDAPGDESEPPAEPPTDEATSTERPSSAHSPPAGGGGEDGGTDSEDGERVEIEFETQPSGADLYLHGTRICTTPCSIEMPKGYRPTFELKKDGYETRRQRVYALSNKTVRFELERD